MRYQKEEKLPSLDFFPSDTIAAIATGVGVSGIGIVRLSGPDALGIADRIFLSKDKLRPFQFKTFTLHYGWIIDPQKQNQIVDEVLLSVMRAPRSYTREDVVEINCHGGIVAQRKILDLLLQHGARLAEPGEFTKRAFLNGRIDLTQAEAILDIVQAKTEAALIQGAMQLQGGLSRNLASLRQELIQILTPIEANIDFPEEETGSLDLSFCRQRLVEINQKLLSFIKSWGLARMLREGVSVVICGRVNVGKSSLLNCLLKQERSIVTSIPGTTRDTVEEMVEINGIPLKIVDTAGILKPRDVVEKKAVLRSHQAISQAGIVILLFDGSQRLTKEDRRLVSQLQGKNILAVINKIDKRQRIEKDFLIQRYKQVLEISAKMGKNIDTLEKKIVDMVLGGLPKITESPFLVNLRHLQLIKKAQKYIAGALNSVDNKVSVEFVSQDIKAALGCLDELLGRSFSQELLDSIFSEFCIGK